MERSGIFSDNMFYCRVHSKHLSKYQISQHLKSSNKHLILQVSHKASLEKSYQNMINDRIQAITKIAIEVQRASIYFIKIITENTLNAISNLDILKKAYRDVIKTKVIDKKVASKEIIKNYQADESVSLAIIEHFNKKLVFESWNLLTENKKVKFVVNDLIKNYTDCFECMATSSNEKFIVTGETNGIIKVWDFINFSQICFLRGHKNKITSLAIGNKNNKIFSGSIDCTLRLWDLRTKTQIYEFKGHKSAISSVVISHDDKTGFSGSDDFTVKMWNLENSDMTNTFSFSFAIKCITLISAGNTLVVASQGVFAFFDLKSEAISEGRSHLNEIISCIQFEKSEKEFILGFNDGSIQIFEKNIFNMIYKAKEHSKAITKIELISNTKLFATSSLDNKVVIWDNLNKVVMKVLDCKSKVMSIYSLKDCNSLYLCLAYDIGQLNYQNLDFEIKLRTNQLSLINIAVSNNLKYVAYGINEIILIGIEENKEISRTPHFECSIKNLIISKKLSIVACADSSGYVNIFKFHTLEPLQKIKLNLNDAKFITISDNERFIGISNYENKFIVYSMEEKRAVCDIKDVMVKAAVFCMNDEVLIYANLNSIHVLDKDYNEYKVLSYQGNVEKIIHTEDESHLLLNLENDRWNCLKINKFKIFYEDADTKKVKKWAKEIKDRSSLAKLLYDR